MNHSGIARNEDRVNELRAYLIEHGTLIPAPLVTADSWWIAAQPCLRLAPGEREANEAAAKSRSRWDDEITRGRVWQ